MKANEIQIGNVKKTFKLCCQANGTKSVRITDLSKELGVKKTILMDYINNNCKLFSTSYFSKAKKESDKVLFINGVYTNPEDNSNTKEWLDKKIIDNKKYIHIDEWNNYGCIEGYYVRLDKEGKESLWRNTDEKIRFLINNNFLTKQTFYTGGYSDCSNHEIDTSLTIDNLRKLEEMGWTHNDLSPLNY